MARRPDLVLEHQDKKITMIDTACLKEKNIHERYYGKLHKYQQQEFEFRERKPGLRIAICTNFDWVYGRRNEKG